MRLSPRMPELGALEILSAIAKTGSLSAAAREVGLTQQAVSARLTSIYRDLRAIWVGGRTPPAGAVRDLLTHVVTGR